ncbi:MAG TPA: L-threonylcarbamoyladenylate synthase [Phycisphaerales bacterium]|nr:L-threonylcarbamoyladenylate synthase [Phycisphaerales bacterium]
MRASPEDIAHAIGLLRARRLVAFPTETVYGLGADALGAEAVAAVFRAKGRPAENPLIVHISGEEMARRVCASWPREAAVLARRFWPGPLTLVLPRAPAVPPIVTAGGASVAVRCPSHPLTLALIDTFGSPLVGPSANRSGHVSPTTAEHVRDSFAEAEVFVLDGGPCAGGIESTVLDLTNDPPTVLRPGLVGAGELSEVLGRPVAALGPEAPPPAGARRSPGLMRSHYAPAAPVRLVGPEELGPAIRAVGGPAVVLGPPGTHAGRNQLIEMPEGAEPYASRLYAALREADAMRPAAILVVRPWGGAAPAGLWGAIADRLARASAPREAR